MAQAEPATQRQEGVTLTTTALPEKVVFCFSPAEGWKIAAGFGIELTVLKGESGLWSEPVPKVLAMEDAYFPGPVRMELRRGHAHRTTVIANLGACYKTELCTPLRFVVHLPLSEAVTSSPCGIP